MKKLLLTITSALLFNFVNAGYATPVELDDLPNELKVKIIINLLPEGQKRIVQVNHSFHDNMPTAKDMMVQETAQELGLNFEEITPFCKNFLMNVRTGNFTIDEYKNHIPFVSAEMDRMVQFGRCNIVFTNSIDNNGKMETICHDREYRNLRNDHHIELRAVNPSRTIFLGVFLPGERYPDDQQLDDQQLDNQQLDRAVKYITATNQIVNLFPADSKFRSFGEGLNSDGTITVGQISENNSTYGFVHNDNGNNIFLENTPEFEQVKPVGVSDKGEIIVGSVVKNSILSLYNSICQKYFRL